MKQLLLLLIVFCSSLTAMAQQNQLIRRSASVYTFSQFKNAKVLQTFGRSVNTEANIHLKDAALVFKQDGKILRAYTKNIVGVVFDDTLHYMKVDSAMARVVAQKGYNYLLCKTTVNMSRLRSEESDVNQNDYFHRPDLGVFLDPDEEKRDEDNGYPLLDTYYFNVQGLIIPANESSFKKLVSKDEMQAFKTLMANRFWSWKDEESLKMLMDFLH